MRFEFSNIVENYISHVNGHIPNYQTVIKKSVDICESFKKTSNILDFGSANGNTLKTLHEHGFSNLHGVEINDEMLDASPKNIATYYKQVPDIKFDVILSNWVLHFNADKFDILKKLYEHLHKDGLLVLTEKTKTDEIIKKNYYNFKRRQGVTQKEIEQKEQSLKGVMHLEDIEWYVTNLKKIGFKNISVIDGSWGFVTFTAKR